MFVFDRSMAGIRTLAASWLTGTAWTDPTGLRRVLRHHLAHTTSAVIAVILAMAALFGLGEARGYWVLCFALIAEIGLVMAARWMGEEVDPARRFRVILVTWPIGFAVLGAVATDLGGEYHGEVVALIALMAAAVVALVEPTRFAIVWGVVSAATVAAGALSRNPTTGEPLMPAAVVIVGVVMAGRLRAIIETFMDQRRQILHAVTRVPSGGDPFETAEAILQPLVQGTSLRNAALIWFTGDDRSVFLSTVGAELPDYTKAGRALPIERNRYLREHAASGPWVTGWGAADAYERGVAAAGVRAAAYAPVAHRGAIVGVLAVGLGSVQRADVLAEQLPILIEVAEFVGSALGPSLADLGGRSASGAMIDDVIASQSFWPVFQPVCDLTTGQIVGYECLSRFQAPIPTARLFAEAAIVGRLRELELATLRVALEAARGLPRACWVSVNVSAALLTETTELVRLIGGVRHRIVLELSEHEAIEDYEPIGAALATLGRGIDLAVDDAGAGFASLRHILEVRPRYVKLDIGLVLGVASDATRRALIAGLVHFAHDAGFTLIAEGIETEADLAALRNLGVELGQGYLLGRPEPLAARPQLRALAG